MNNPSFELGAPDEALVERFNAFVAEHAGRYALGNGEVQLETYNFDPDNDPAETGYVIGISEMIESSGQTHRLDTEFHSHQGTINKALNIQTQEELEATKRKIREFELETATESALIGDDDADKATTSLLLGKLNQPQNLEGLFEGLSQPGAEEYPANATEVTELLDSLRPVVNPEQSR